MKTLHGQEQVGPVWAIPCWWAQATLHVRTVTANPWHHQDAGRRHNADTRLTQNGTLSPACSYGSPKLLMQLALGKVDASPFAEKAVLKLKSKKKRWTRTIWTTHEKILERLA